MALAIPACADDVTDGWLEQVLRRRHGNEYKLTSTEQSSIVGTQAVLCSEMRCVSCRGQLGSKSITDHLVAKLLPRDPTMRSMVTSLNMPQRETPVYTDLLPKLSAFERSHGRDVIAAMTVTCLHAAISADGDDRLRSVILLENLQPAGFWTPGPTQLPEDALPEAVRQMARLAATSNVWLRHCNLRSLPYLFSTQLERDHLAQHFIGIGVQKIETRLRERGQQALLQKLQRMQEIANELISRELQPRDDHLRVITHGDFRDGNLLLKRLPVGGWDVRLIDWQVSMLSHPVVDLVYLLMLSLPREVMARCEAAALRTYCAEFAACTAALGADGGLSLEKLNADFRRAKLLGLMWCLSLATFWDWVAAWPDHCIDIAEEVDRLGLLDGLVDQQPSGSG
ncbi:uncharacterized protein LOC119095599 [Pollicipes pollicipes]|uniref:uncharacterized protein LOC119095599 n=1 Tax=Pollicipes pollicipes TaxID=41117 RepID=UPI0018852512|nr:uncharacterized protein LOC119095599 [Pollicipes pollicipes]